MRPSKAMIFAAGLGTRLRPLTDSMPKALVEVAGAPMLERVIRRIYEAGISEFVVNTHHFAPMIDEFLKENQSFGLEIAISHEKETCLETGGGIRYAEPLLKGDGRFLVHNVDIISDLDFEYLFSKDDPKSLASLVVTDAKTDRYLLFDKQMRLVGWTNSRTGEVRSPYPSLATPGSLVDSSLVESDFDCASQSPSDVPFRNATTDTTLAPEHIEDCYRLAFCGIHVISDKVFALMRSWPSRFSIIDFYLCAAAHYDIKAVYIPNLQLIDIGTPDSLKMANELLK